MSNQNKNNSKNSYKNSIYYSEIEQQCFEYNLECQRQIAIEKRNKAEEEKRDAKIEKDNQIKLAIIAIIIFFILYGMFREPAEPIIERQEDPISHTKSKGEMEFDAEMDAYGGYDNYKKREMIDNCMSGCNPLEEECGYCYE